MLGSLKLPLGWFRYVEVFGGPYKKVNLNKMIGVKMAEEIHTPCDISIPTRDFDVPDVYIATTGLKLTVNTILRGNPVYIGCMGGKGRTGLFMAILAKAFGVDNPVEYVRKHYYTHAVETPEQYSYVEEFEIPQEVVDAIATARFWSVFKFGFNLTDSTAAPNRTFKR